MKIFFCIFQKQDHKHFLWQKPTSYVTKIHSQNFVHPTKIKRSNFLPIGHLHFQCLLGYLRSKAPNFQCETTRGRNAMRVNRSPFCLQCLVMTSLHSYEQSEKNYKNRFPTSFPLFFNKPKMVRNDWHCPQTSRPKVDCTQLYRYEQSIIL